LTILKPYKLQGSSKGRGDNKEKAKVEMKSDYEKQLELKERLKKVLENEKLFPRVDLLISSFDRDYMSF
jgi:hypothetical protein